MTIDDILTHRELQIATLIADGYGYAEIGAQVGIGEQSVKNLATRIYCKLGLVQPGRKPAVLLARLVMREQMEDESP